MRVMIFQNEYEFKNALYRLGCDQKEIDEQVMPHERAHKEAARALNYQASYGIEKKLDTTIIIDGKRQTFFVITPFVNLPPKISKRDLAKIALSPKNPSSSDYKLINQQPNQKYK